MKMKEEKKVSSAKISFLKNGFFAAALVIVVVLFAVSAAPTSAILGGPGKIMNFSFADNTGGKFSPDLIYFALIGIDPSTGNLSHVNQSGNLIECQVSDNDAPGHLSKNGENYSNYFYNISGVPEIPVPKLDSGRVFIGLGSPLYIKINLDAAKKVAFAGPNVANPSDPNIDVYFDWIEFTIDNAGFHGNPTQVDQFGFPMTIELTAPNFSAKVGITESRSALFKAYRNETPADFHGLVQEPYRIVAPFKGTPEQSKNLTNYFDQYISEVWQYYNSSTNATHKLNFTIREGSFTGQVNSTDHIFYFTDKSRNPNAKFMLSKPKNKEVFLCNGVFISGNATVNGTFITGNETSKAIQAQVGAAFNRHVVKDPANWCNTSQYYQSTPANYYAQFWHPYSIANKAYGFSYDDVCQQSSLIEHANPEELKVSISWD